MSWLNLNDSFNNIKGQLSTFANTVLAEENEGSSTSQQDVEALRQVCLQQRQEIEQLRKSIEIKNPHPTESSTASNKLDNVELKDDSNWDWPTQEAKTDQIKTDETITNLKQKIAELEREKLELGQSLDQIDKNHQENIENLIALKDKLQNENQELKENYTAVSLQQNKQGKLEKQLKDELENLKLKYKEEKSDNSTILESDIVKTELSKLQQQIFELTSSNEALEKLLNDTNIAYEAKTTDLQALQTEIKALKITLQANKKTLEEYEKRIQSDVENGEKLALLLEGYEQKVNELKNEIELLKSNNVETRSADNVEELHQKINKLIEKEANIHKNYILILSNNVKDCIENTNITESLVEADPHIEEFNNQVKNILTVLLDFKEKCTNLEKEIYQVKEEKNKMLHEKNHEIEKLIQNSEMLSQEVIMKTHALNDYEEECSELMKNNEILINKLTAFKNTNLETIAETNEDNVAMLETQLENANKKIADLEKSMPVMSLNQATIVTDGGEKLLEQLSSLQIENAIMKNEIEHAKEKIEVSSAENKELNLELESMHAEAENTEYQFTEININLESLSEENKLLKSELNQLLSEIKILTMQMAKCKNNNEERAAELAELNLQISNEKEMRLQFEEENKVLTEKIQNLQISETSIKNQYDCLNAEFISLSETKNRLDENLKQTLSNLSQFQINFDELQSENDDLKQLCNDLQKKSATACKDSVVQTDTFFKDIEQLKQENQALRKECERLQDEIELFQKITHDQHIQTDLVENVEKEVPLNSETNVGDTANFTLEFNNIKSENCILKARVNELQNYETQIQNDLQKIPEFEYQIQELNKTRNELIKVVQEKHQENVMYHTEIQRLSQLINVENGKNNEYEKYAQMNITLQEELRVKSKELEKLTDLNTFLNEKCDLLSQSLLEEQAKVQKFLSEKPSESDKEIALKKKLERLQSHLIEMEEHYTQELIQSQEKTTLLQAKVNEIEQTHKESSTMYTSVSIRANQQVEALQQQLQLLTNQREELKKKISDADDENHKKTAALKNLQAVLEQFQKEKEHDVQKETERVRRQIKVEQKVQEDLCKEIEGLKLQLEENKQGLQAGIRLSNQLEMSKRQNNKLKEEASLLSERLVKLEEELVHANSSGDGKVDKSLIKNLIIGFVSSNKNFNKDQLQILKIIATVLDFNKQEHDKISLQQTHGSWLSFLAPQGGDQVTQESLSQAFVKFLESESKPRVIPSLLLQGGANSATPSESNSTTPRQSPVILSEIVLPTFADFGQSRNSSSILKDVLKDSSNN